MYVRSYQMYKFEIYQEFVCVLCCVTRWEVVCLGVTITPGMTWDLCVWTDCMYVPEESYCGCIIHR